MYIIYNIGGRDVRGKVHQIYTIKENKVALTSYYDKMKLMNANDCIPYGYNPI